MAIKTEIMVQKKYILSLTKSEVNKLYALVKESGAKKTPINVRRRLFELYINANNIIVNGGGA